MDSNQDLLIGCMLSEIPFANMPVMFRNNGLDFFIVDAEHGGFSNEALSSLIMISRLCGLTIVIRLPDNQRRDIIRLMDMGADALLLPMTGSRAEIEKVVSYAKYAPLGKRGISTTRAHSLYQNIDLQQYMKKANDHVKIFAQIETREGLENIDDILSVAGIHGAIIGPNDLACDLDCIGNEKPVLSAINQVGAAVGRAGLVGGIITTNRIYIKEAKKCGMKMICAGSELSMIKASCQQLVQQINGI